MLNAAMLDPLAATVLRSGLVVTAFTATGVSELDVAAVCAVPEAVGHSAAAVERKPPSLHVVPDDGVRLEAARERVEEAIATVAGAQEELQHQNARVSTLNARRLQLLGEVEELQRRLAGLENDVDLLDEELEEAAESVEEAEEELAEAQENLAVARKELDKLGG
jgi:chromosome segregation ATPase